ncbi:MAG: cobyrinate a,c-diamide synthase [Mariprofundaceae bacterium]
MNTYLVAGTQSSCGKTTVTLALMQYLRSHGSVVAAFKSGPDFLDPMWHKAACGRNSYNLDTRMLGSEMSAQLLAEKSLDADIAIIEGVMGLFDGAKGVGGEGSSAHLAQSLSMPVLLVVSAKGMSGSIVPLVEGFVARAKAMDVHIAGIIANHVGSENHAKILRELLIEFDLPPLLAWVGKHAPALPERHLGLKMPSELDLPDFSADLHVEQDIFTMASYKKTHVIESSKSHLLSGKTIAIAKDAAFCFVYPANLEWLVEQGASVEFFSPLLGEDVPQNSDALWLPGGYPELHLKALSTSTSLISIAAFIDADKSVLAECGGMMVLGQSIDAISMANVLPCSFSMQGKLAGLGYRDDASGLKGHEFHHSKRVTHTALTPAFDVTRGDVGMRYKNLRASYIHWYFPSKPNVIANWLGV